MGSSATQYQQVGASDQAIGVSGNVGSAVAKEFGVAVAQGGTLTTGTRVVGDTTNSTITFNQGETGLGATFAETIKDLTEQNSKTLAEVLSNQSTANVPSANKDIPDPEDTNAATDTKFDWSKVDWLFWGGIAAALAGAWYFLKKR